MKCGLVTGPSAGLPLLLSDRVGDKGEERRDGERVCAVDGAGSPVRGREERLYGDPRAEAPRSSRRSRVINNGPFFLPHPVIIGHVVTRTMWRVRVTSRSMRHGG